MTAQHYKTLTTGKFQIISIDASEEKAVAKKTQSTSAAAAANSSSSKIQSKSSKPPFSTDLLAAAQKENAVSADPAVVSLEMASPGSGVIAKAVAASSLHTTRSLVVGGSGSVVSDGALGSGKKNSVETTKAPVAHVFDKEDATSQPARNGGNKVTKATKPKEKNLEKEPSVQQQQQQQQPSKQKQPPPPKSNDKCITTAATTAGAAAQTMSTGRFSVFHHPWETFTPMMMGSFSSTTAAVTTQQQKTKVSTDLLQAAAKQPQAVVVGADPGVVQFTTWAASNSIKEFTVDLTEVNEDDVDEVIPVVAAAAAKKTEAKPKLQEKPKVPQEKVIQEMKKETKPTETNPPKKEVEKEKEVPEKKEESKPEVSAEHSILNTTAQTAVLFIGDIEYDSATENDESANYESLFETATIAVPAMTTPVKEAIVDMKKHPVANGQVLVEEKQQQPQQEPALGNGSVPNTNIHSDVSPVKKSSPDKKAVSEPVEIVTESATVEKEQEEEAPSKPVEVHHVKSANTAVEDLQLPEEKQRQSEEKVVDVSFTPQAQEEPQEEEPWQMVEKLLSSELDENGFKKHLQPHTTLHEAEPVVDPADVPAVLADISQSSSPLQQRSAKDKDDEFSEVSRNMKFDSEAVSPIKPVSEADDESKTASPMKTVCEPDEMETSTPPRKKEEFPVLKKEDKPVPVVVTPIQPTRPSYASALRKSETGATTAPTASAPAASRVKTAQPTPVNVPLVPPTGKLQDGLVVLISNQSLDATVTQHQSAAINVLMAKDIAFQAVDAGDSENKEKISILLRISGKPVGQFPQFFRIKNGVTTFWGGYERFEIARDIGILAKELGGAEGDKSHLQAPQFGNKNSKAQEVVAAVDAAENAKENVAPAVDEPKKFLVLVSNQSMNREVLSNQEKVFTVLKSKSIPYETLDGADPANKEKRGELFNLSGLRGKYPQLFLIENGKTTFWGDWDRFETANDDGSLSTEFGKDPIYGVDKKKKKGAVEEPNGVTNNLEGRKVLMLASQQSLNLEVIADQEKAFSVLTSQKIPFETMDAADPNNKDMCAELFKLSGVTEKYPQFFLVEDDGKTTFWCDWEKFASLQDRGVLLKAFNGESVDIGELGTQTKAKSKPPKVQQSKSRSVDAGEAKDANKVPQSVPTSEAVDIMKSAETDITVYGATGFVARHILNYLMQSSIHLQSTVKVTLSGRNEDKLKILFEEYKSKMSSLRTIKGDKSVGKCSFDFFVAEASDVQALKKMVARTKVIINCAGPFFKYSNNVVAACAELGTDYVDITGEVSWAGEMRALHGDAARKSGARLISLCGFDSVPSDIAVHTCVQALRNNNKDKPVEIQSATTWHSFAGVANGGTLITMAEMPVNLSKCLRRPVPFLLDDPLILASPTIRANPKFEAIRDRMARGEWYNQLFTFMMHPFMRLGISIPCFMAPANAKVVQASAVTLQYGSQFTYQERYVPAGFTFTSHLGLLSIIPAVIAHIGILLGVAALRLPFVGPALIRCFMPPGTGYPDAMCQKGTVEVYAEAVTAKTEDGKIDKATCLMRFEGDPGNWVTAQCSCEAALALLYDKKKLPPRSVDGFGTPAELLGGVLLKRLTQSQVRPVDVVTRLHKSASKFEWRMHV